MKLGNQTYLILTVVSFIHLSLYSNKKDQPEQFPSPEAMENGDVVFLNVDVQEYLSLKFWIF